jgi:hypothetical protein
MDRLPSELLDRVYFATPYRLANLTNIVDTTPNQSHRDYRSDAEYADYYLNLSFTWERVRNTYCHHFGGIFYNSTLYYYDVKQQRSERSNGANVMCFDIVFNFVHRWRYYGHYIIDYVPVLTALSRFYLLHGHFIVRQRSYFSYRALRLFGIPGPHIIDAPYGTVVFGAEVFMVRPLQLQLMNALLLERMRSVFVRRLGLDKSPPFRYVIVNRPGKREILNAYRIVKRFNGSVPLEVYDAQYAGQFRKHLLYFNEMILLMGVQSSGTLNAIFQQSNTVFIIVESRESDGHLFVAMAKIFRRHAFIFRHNSFCHFARAIKLPMGDVFPLFEMGLRKAIEIQKNYKPIESVARDEGMVLGPEFVLRKATPEDLDPPDWSLSHVA